MYLEHFGLSEYPFSTAPDPRFYYASAKHDEALACLIYAVEQQKGFALITGDIGAGKSMLCHAALERFGDNVDAALISYTLLGPEEFCESVCEGFNLPTTGRKTELRNSLKHYLIDQKAHGRNVVLIIDEAQNLSEEVLEELRNLGNIETPTEKLLQIILLGQPELRQMIRTPQLRPLEQRIILRFHLGKLSAEDVAAYIDHRLSVAGAPDGTIFDADAKQEIFETSEGVPRLINIICDQALLLAYIEDETAVTVEAVKSVVADWEGYYAESSDGTVVETTTDVDKDKTDEIVLRSRQVGPRDAKFVIRRDNRLWGSFNVRDGAELVVGRDADLCDLAILDPAISRRHCTISNISGLLVIEDLASTNGTFVNGERIARYDLTHDDVIQMGHCTLTVRFYFKSKTTDVTHDEDVSPEDEAITDVTPDTDDAPL